MKKEELILFATGMTQTILVASNTVFLARGFVYGIFLMGFLISYVWSHNVKKIAFSTKKDRIIYATGAMLGTGIGYYFAVFLIKFV